MERKIYLLTVFAFILMCSCHSSGDSMKKPSIVTDTVFVPKVKTPSDKKQAIDSLINLVKTKGNIDAYNQVHVYYAERLKDQEILNLSILMAHKYKYNYAYFTVYTTIVNQETYGLKDLDEQTKNLALYYLFRSYELGYKDALYTIQDDLGEKAPIQKSSYYLKKMIEYDSKK